LNNAKNNLNTIYKKHNQSYHVRRFSDGIMELSQDNIWVFKNGCLLKIMLFVLVEMKKKKLLASAIMMMLSASLFTNYPNISM